MAPCIRYPVPDLEERSKAKYQIPIIRAADDFDWNNKQRALDFEAQHIRFESTEEEDKDWHFERALGKGGYGLVGLWVKKNRENKTIDSLAVKELSMPQSNVYRLSPDGRPLPEEALIQTALQRKNCGPVLQMRGMSILTAPPNHREKIRYYLEYCEFGDLDLVLRAYNNIQFQDQKSLEHVPEPFLWHLLHSFAQVMIAMEQAPFEHPNTDQVGKDPYILHLDIKLENIMLGQGDDEDIIQGYPSVRVGDWGLARLTSLRDMRNSVEWRWHGTKGWYPPEQMEKNTFGQDWNPQPPWRVDTTWNCHPYSTAHSMFAFASILFRLMVLDIEHTNLNRNLSYAYRRQTFTQFMDYKIFDGGDMDFNVNARPTNYTPLLKETVAKCMHFDPALRLTAVELERVTRDMCTRWATTRFQDGQDMFPVLNIARVEPLNYDIIW